MRCVGQVEIDPFCRTVLAHHFPEVPRHDDVRTTPHWWLSRPRPVVHLVAGGFPCQPFSTAGLRTGTRDARWGWPWFRDVVRAVRPVYVLVENVAALLDDRHAFGRILADLAADGFDADWTLLSACTLGAPHTRQRLFLVAHTPRRDGQQPVHLPPPMASRRTGIGTTGGAAWPERWLPEPGLGRVAHELPKRLVAPHLRAFGNAVVPAVAEHVGRLILDHHRQEVTA
jgi:DNA (cytosine-5)-methyltransferase 1